MPSIAESLEAAETILAEGCVAEPLREARSLLVLALNRDKAFIYARPEYILSAEEYVEFRDFVERRANREPFQYISGIQEFFGLEFDVTPDVLIPRPETEMIVENAIEVLADESGVSFCEVGVGSGCIAVSILHHLKQVSALGTDISSKALKIAGQNSEKHSVAERLRLVESDVLDSVGDEKFDLVVSNPPYVPVSDIDGLQAEVRAFEPVGALTDGGDGLSIIRRIVEGSPRYLRPNSFLLMEIGFDQAGKVAAMFDPAVWKTLDLLPDLQGIPRLVRARLI